MTMTAFAQSPTVFPAPTPAIQATSGSGDSTNSNWVSEGLSPRKSESLNWRAGRVRAIWTQDTTGRGEEGRGSYCLFEAGRQRYYCLLHLGQNTPSSDVVPHALGDGIHFEESTGSSEFWHNMVHEPQSA